MQQQQQVVTPPIPSTTTTYPDALWDMGVSAKNWWTGNNTEKLSAFKLRFEGEDLSPGQRLAFLLDHKSNGFASDEKGLVAAKAFYTEVLTTDGSLKETFNPFFWERS